MQALILAALQPQDSDKRFISKKRSQGTIY